MYSSIEQINNSCEFPCREDFFSELKLKHIDQEEYDTAKSEYYRRKKLPSSDPEKIYNMGNWLEHYNRLDVDPLIEAVTNMSESYYKYFETDLFSKSSLPAISLDAMFTLHDKNLPYAYTFKNEEVHQIFKSNVIGGITNIYKKHICLTDRECPDAAKFSAKGGKFTSCLFLDFNAMYLWSQGQDLPLTAGKFSKYLFCF